MTRSIDRWPATRLDILDLSLFLARTSPETANRFVQAVESTLERLSANPGMGSEYQSKNPQIRRLRIWRVSGFPNHIICYRDLADRIEVIRVLHGASNWQSILRIQ